MKQAITQPFESTARYTEKNSAACHMEKAETPRSEPMEPHSDTAMYKNTNTHTPRPMNTYHHRSQESATQNNPSVEAMPLPPLNFMVTGKM